MMNKNNFGIAVVLIFLLVIPIAFSQTATPTAAALDRIAQKRATAQAELSQLLSTGAATGTPTAGTQETPTPTPGAQETPTPGSTKEPTKPKPTATPTSCDATKISDDISSVFLTNPASARSKWNKWKTSCGGKNSDIDAILKEWDTQLKKVGS